MADLDPIFIAVKEAAHQLSVSTWKVYELLNSGELKGKYIGSSRKIYFSSVKEYADGLSDERAS